MVCTLIGQLSEAAQRAQLGSLRGAKQHTKWHCTNQLKLWFFEKKKSPSCYD